MEKQKEIVRVKDLRLPERELYRSLGFSRAIYAWLFGGFYIFPFQNTKQAASVYLPPLPMRIYIKWIRPRLNGFVFAYERIQSKKQYRVFR